MPYTNREVAVILASELNGHDPGLWFYRVERHIDNKRWIIVREGREFYFRRAMHRQPTEKRFGLTVRVYPRQAHGPARGGQEYSDVILRLAALEASKPGPRRKR